MQALWIWFWIKLYPENDAYIFFSEIVVGNIVGRNYFLVTHGSERVNFDMENNLALTKLWLLGLNSRTVPINEFVWPTDTGQW